jgi:hypothetical protein
MGDKGDTGDKGEARADAAHAVKALVRTPRKQAGVQVTGTATFANVVFGSSRAPALEAGDRAPSPVLGRGVFVPFPSADERHFDHGGRRCG